MVVTTIPSEVNKPSSTTNVHDSNKKKHSPVVAEDGPTSRIHLEPAQQTTVTTTTTSSATQTQRVQPGIFLPDLASQDNHFSVFRPNLDRQTILATMVDLEPQPLVSHPLDLHAGSAFQAVTDVSRLTTGRSEDMHGTAAKSPIKENSQTTSTQKNIVDLTEPLWAEDDSPQGLAHRQGTRYEGPVDVDNVSLTSSIHSSTYSVEEEEEEEAHELVSPKSNNDIPEKGIPNSPATPLTKNTSSHSHQVHQPQWFVHEKEPFQRPGRMPPSPPVSMRHILTSRQTLPSATSVRSLNVSHHTVQSTTRTASITMASLPRVSPPLSPLNLDESVIGLSSEFRVVPEDYNTATTTTNGVPESPPMSPFSSYDVIQHQKQLLQTRLALLTTHNTTDDHTNNASNNRSRALSHTSISNCSKEMLDLVMSLPATITPASALVTSIEEGDDDDDDEKDTDRYDTMQTTTLEAKTKPRSFPPVRTLKRTYCSARMLELALQLPYTITPESALVTPIEASDVILDTQVARTPTMPLLYTMSPQESVPTTPTLVNSVAEEELVLKEPVETEADAKIKSETNHRETFPDESALTDVGSTLAEKIKDETEVLSFAPSYSPTPSSPPTLSRTTWFGNEREPFQIIADMQEEPTTPPMSGTNAMGARIIRRIADENPVDSDGADAKQHVMVMSPPISPRPTELDMTTGLLEELNESYLLREQKSARKAHHKRSKQEREQDLKSAQQVVRVILKGTDGHKYNETNDMTSSPACFEAIRQYALLRVQTSKLTSQLEDSKKQLKDLYCEWKSFSQEINPNQSNVKSCNADDQRSVLMLQQLLSDDESIYKEDDDEDSVKTTDKFCLTRHVDEEKDAFKAVSALHHEMHNELNTIRSILVDQREQKQIQHNMKQTESRDQPDGFDIHESENADINVSKSMDPFSETNDSFLLSKIEELTAKIRNMENDRVVLTGYMDQLAQDVVQMDHASFSQSNTSTEEMEGDESWTSFSQNFPIYQVKESDMEDKANADEIIEKSEDVAAPGPAALTTTSDAAIIHRKTSKPAYRPLSLALRSCKFHGSYDSDHDLTLPVRLPGSRGVSFELKKESREDNDEEDDINIQTFSQIPLGKQQRTISFDSVLSRRSDAYSSSRPSSWLKKRKSSSRLLRKTRSTDSGYAKHTKLEDDLEEPFLIDQRSPLLKPKFMALDAEIARRLKSPFLQLELSLPPKAYPIAIGNSGDEDPPASPFKPLGLDGHARICANLMKTKKEMKQTQAHLKVLEIREQHAIHELERGGYDTGNVGGTAGFRSSTCTASSMVSSLDYSISTGATNDMPTQNQLKARESTSSAISSLAYSLASGETDFNHGGSSHGSSDASNHAMQVRLKEKTEECTRLSQQVQSLSEQLENQLERVSMLERGMTKNTSEMDVSLKSSKNRSSRVRTGLRNIIGKRLNGIGGKEKNRSKRCSPSYSLVDDEKCEIGEQDDNISGGASGEESKAVGATIDAIFERDVQPLVEFTVPKEVSEDFANTGSMCERDISDTRSDGVGASDSSISSGMAVPQFQGLEGNKDPHHTHDADLSTIYLLKRRVADLEAENRKLKKSG